MDVQDIVALTVVGGAVFYVGRSLWRMMEGRSGQCGGGCGCSASREPKSARGDNRGLTRTPLMSPDQIGKPAQPDSPPVEQSSH